MDGLKLKLGRATDEHDLDGVPRTAYRQGPGPALPGLDIWNAYEAGFLLTHGGACSGLLRIIYSAESPAIVESKSLKLFLNHLQQQVFVDLDAYLQCVSCAVRACVGMDVSATWTPSHEDWERRHLTGSPLDHCVAAVHGNPDHRQLAVSHEAGTHCFHTHLFGSRCPVTGQPDWASVWMHWQGDLGLTEMSLLSYLLSYRDLGEFHESCCDRIATDLTAVLKPQSLTVACHFLRRGGIDITPVRWMGASKTYDFYPTWRQ